MSKRAHMRMGAWYSAAAVGIAAFLLFVGFAQFSPALSFVRIGGGQDDASSSPPQLDRRAYDEKLLALAHVATSSPWYYAFLTGTTTPLTADGQPTTTKSRRPLWPVKTVYPETGAILPFHRIVAYYGNFYSIGMGVLGEYPPDVVLQKLASTSAMWAAADPSTPVIPAIHYIAVTAQFSPSKTGLYIARMPDDQVEKALALAAQIHGLVFLDFQVGLSNVQRELPFYEKFLALPNVNVGVDPEFSMKDGMPPGREIGTLDATDINWVAGYLAKIVRDNHLPPKILIVHRFTQDMITNAARIQPLPEVQIVMDMDGWGSKAKKLTTYTWMIAAEPVQFTGFKLFYKNDIKPPSTGMYTPAEVLSLTPAPIYIQYQ